MIPMDGVLSLQLQERILLWWRFETHRYPWPEGIRKRYESNYCQKRWRWPTGSMELQRKHYFDTALTWIARYYLAQGWIQSRWRVQKNKGHSKSATKCNFKIIWIHSTKSTFSKMSNIESEAGRSFTAVQRSTNPFLPTTSFIMSWKFWNKRKRMIVLLREKRKKSDTMIILLWESAWWETVIKSAYNVFKYSRFNSSNHCSSLLFNLPSLLLCQHVNNLFRNLFKPIINFWYEKSSYAKRKISKNFF